MMRQKNLQTQQGFSLVEILIVIALIGLVVGMAIPSFVQARRYANVTQRVNELFVPLSRARNLAMKKQRPVLIIVQATPPNRLRFTALLDQDYVTAPGFNGNVNGSSTEPPLPKAEDPFGSPTPVGMVVDPFSNRTGAVNNNRQFSFGYPNPTTSAYFASQTNLLTAGTVCAGTTCWFGFDSSGKLIPNGLTPFLLPTVRNVTNLQHMPQLAAPFVNNNGGPEFYFAEFNAANINRANAHVYRKIEITPIGGIRIQSWNARTNSWRGTQ